MAIFFPALAAAAGPIVKMVLLSLGIGLISFAALTVLTDALIGHVQSSYGALPSSMASLADLLGLGSALGIVLGGIVARASYAAVTRLGKLSA